MEARSGRGTRVAIFRLSQCAIWRFIRGTTILVIATHGRGIWIIDDITPLRVLTPATLASDVVFIRARPTVLKIPANGGWSNGDASYVGNNSPDAAVITYYLKKRHIFGDMKIEVRDTAGRLVGTIPSTKRRGLSRVTWSMRLPPPRVPPAASAAFSAAFGPRVLPGTYTVKMTKDDKVYTMPLQLVSDPRETHTMADRQAQFALANKLVGMLGDMSFAVERMNGVRSDLEDRASRLPAGDPLAQRLRDASSSARRDAKENRGDQGGRDDHRRGAAPGESH